MGELVGGNAVFLDTNILVYAVDFSDKEKHGTASAIVARALSGEQEVCVSNQVLSELYATLVRLKVPDEKASDFVESLSDTAVKKADYSFTTVFSAIRLSRDCGAHFWDALIAATMIENGVFEILTENEKDFAKIPGIRARNPFK